METVQESTVTATLAVENIGGISSTELDFRPGVTTLVGRNATNRTSLLQAIMGALGGREVTLNSGADSGRVELHLGNELYTRELVRKNGSVRMSGSPYLQGSAARSAELFAFLHESNDARRAVERGDELREILMEPVDTAEIEAEIQRILEERSDIEAQLESLEGLSDRLPGLEEKRASLTAEIEEVEERLAERRATLDEIDGTIEARREDREELDEAISTLEGTRSDLDQVKREQRTERRSIESLEEERSELEAELDELPDGPSRSLEDIDARLTRLREQAQTAKAELTQLQSIVQFNEEMLEEGGLSSITVGDGSTHGTDELLPAGEQEVSCWTCGSNVERGAIEETIEQLRSVRASRMDDRTELREEIEELEEAKSTVRKQEKRRERLQNRLADTESELEERRNRIEALEAREDELVDQIEELEDKVSALNQEENDELLELNREVNQLEFELEDLESQRTAITEKIEDIEEQLAGRDELVREQEELSEKLTDLRTRVERIEAEAVESFNNHMSELLELLEYDNIDRVWIEQVEREVKDGRRTVSKSAFDLHIVRSEDGTVHEDEVSHLSESEREVIGLVFALAGYLVHDLHETVPFMVLDSLEAIDADRIAALLEYFEGYADFLVVALLTQDAAAVDIDHQAIDEI